jgi:molybdate transport system substrate-binding protein
LSYGRGAVLLLLACGDPTAAAALHVSAAVSLRPALQQAIAAYRSQHPSVDVLLNTGGSGVLLQQALRGAPVDVLISASPEEIDRLIAEARALPASRRRIASNGLVIVTPPALPVPARLEDLLRPEFDRVAVGNARTAPLGRYTREALRALELWERILGRLVPAENARQVIEYVARGEVAAGIVYRTDARLLQDRVVTGPEVPSHLHAPITYEGVVLATPGKQAASVSFLDWLASEPGRAVLARHGFRSP